MFKANEFRSYSYFFPFKSKFHSAVLESSRVPTSHIYSPLSYSIDFSGLLPGNAYVPMQRIINVSNLPSDMIQKSPFRDSEIEDVQYDRFINEELYTSYAPNEHFSKSVQISHQNSIFQLHDRTRSLRNVYLEKHHNINF